MKIALAFIVSIALSVVTYLSLQSSGVTVVLVNAGPEPMHAIVIHVIGAAYPIGELESGGRASVVVRPQGESHVEIEQAAGPRLVVDCYMESGYGGSLLVQASSTKVVSVKNEVTL